MSRGPEAKEQTKVTKFLKMMSMPYVKMTGSGKQGWPDLTILIGGRLVGMEMKARGKKPDEQQMVRRKEILGHNGVWLCYDNVKDVRSAIAVLINLPWVKPIDYTTLPESIVGKEAVSVSL